MFKSKFGAGAAQTRPTRSKAPGGEEQPAEEKEEKVRALRNVVRAPGASFFPSPPPKKTKGGWTKVEKWGRAVHQYKGSPGSKELSFAKGDEFKLFAEAQGWYKAFKLPLENKESGMVPGNYIKIIPEPSGGASAAPAAAPPASAAPSSPRGGGSSSPRAAEAAKAVPLTSSLDDALARASRRRGLSKTELESENTLKVRIQELENELKNAEFRHRSEMSGLKAEHLKMRERIKELENENTLLENKALLMETAGSMSNRASAANPDSEELARLRVEVESLADSKKSELAKSKQQYERKMERAQAEIDELQEQTVTQAKKITALEEQVKQGGGGGGGGGSGEREAALQAQVEDLEGDNLAVRAELKALKDQVGGYLDAIDDLKDELAEAQSQGGGSQAEEARLRETERTLLKEIAELEAKEDERVEQVNELMATNKALMREVKKLQAQHGELKEQHRAAEAELDELRLRVEEQKSTGSADGASVVELEARVRALSAERDALNASLQQLRTEQSDAQEQLDVVRQEFEAERDALNAQVAELTAAQAQGSSKLLKHFAVVVEENEALFKRCDGMASALADLDKLVDTKDKQVAELSEAIKKLMKR